VRSVIGGKVSQLFVGGTVRFFGVTTEPATDALAEQRWRFTGTPQVIESARFFTFGSAMLNSLMSCCEYPIRKLHLER
jgi:hypothetical protein